MQRILLQQQLQLEDKTKTKSWLFGFTPFTCWFTPWWWASSSFQCWHVDDHRTWPQHMPILKNWWDSNLESWLTTLVWTRNFSCFLPANSEPILKCGRESHSAETQCWSFFLIGVYLGLNIIFQNLQMHFLVYFFTLFEEYRRRFLTIRGDKSKHHHCSCMLWHECKFNTVRNTLWVLPTVKIVLMDIWGRVNGELLLIYEEDDRHASCPNLMHLLTSLQSGFLLVCYNQLSFCPSFWLGLEVPFYHILDFQHIYTHLPGHFFIDQTGFLRVLLQMDLISSLVWTYMGLSTSRLSSYTVRLFKFV